MLLKQLVSDTVFLTHSFPLGKIPMFPLFRESVMSNPSIIYTHHLFSRYLFIFIPLIHLTNIIPSLPPSLWMFSSCLQIIPTFILLTREPLSPTLFSFHPSYSVNSHQSHHYCHLVLIPCWFLLLASSGIFSIEFNTCILQGFPRGLLPHIPHFPWCLGFILCDLIHLIFSHLRLIHLTI